MSLIIRSDNGDFDLYGNEKIVHTSSIFNIENISGRSGDYTNEFKLPLTNNNITLIGHANILIANSTSIYQRIQVDLITNGTLFKKGFLSVESIDDNINCRFYSGNSNFYNSAKDLSINDLEWSDLDHYWNYTDALSSITSDLEYFYPAIDYNGQTLAGDTVDLRKILPSTKVKAVIDRMFTALGYTHNIYDLTTSIDKMCLPYSNKNATISSAVQLLNSVDVSRNYDYGVYEQYSELRQVFFPSYPADQTLGTFYFTSLRNTNFNQVVTTGSSSYFDFVTQQYTCSYAGAYTYDCKIELSNYDSSSIAFITPVGSYDIYVNTYIVCYLVSGGNRYPVKQQLCNVGRKTEAWNTTNAFYSISGLTQTFTTDTITGTVNMNIGDRLEFEIRIQTSIYSLSLGAGGPWYTNSITVIDTIDYTVKNTSYLTIDLNPSLVFGGLITYSSMLPKVKCSDFLKDICIREGLILDVNEDTKTVTAFKIDDLETNKINAIDWSDKLDESKLPEIRFVVDSYCQNNYFNHAPDKTIVNSNNGANYNLAIANENLAKEKIFYTSPFAETESRVFNSRNVAYINLYNTSTGKFDNDVVPRILYFEDLTSSYKVTDGTTTSALSDVRKVYFIDTDDLTYAMGFGINLIPNNSASIISIIKNLKIVKLQFNINRNDISNINYSYPIWVNKHQSYFFLSSTNQFNLTQTELTEVELIKLS